MTMTHKIRTYSEFRRLDSFEDRFKYLALRGVVGAPTFGFDRWMNQRFYTSAQWRQLRFDVIARERGCDLGVEGYEVHDRLYIHHMNPMTVANLKEGDEEILDIEFLVATSQLTHNAIHYGDEKLLRKPFVPRRAGDTKLW